MRRLFILVPSVELTETLVQELGKLDIPQSRMHVVASIDQQLKNLPEASIWQKTELAHGLEWGTGIGGTAGLLGGLLTVAFPLGGVVLGGGALLIGAAAGAGVGAAMMGLVKGHEHNHQLDDFKTKLDAGEILLMLDVPYNEVETVSQSIIDMHPDAEISISAPS